MDNISFELNFNPSTKLFECALTKVGKNHIDDVHFSAESVEKCYEILEEKISQLTGKSTSDSD